MIAFFYCCKWALAWLLMTFMPASIIPLFLVFIAITQMEVSMLKNFTWKHFKTYLKKGMKTMEAYILLGIVTLSLFLFVRTCVEAERKNSFRLSPSKAQLHIYPPRPICGDDCSLCNGDVEVPHDDATPTLEPTPQPLTDVTAEQLAKEIEEEKKSPAKKKKNWASQSKKQREES